jgi:hypothetical protein
MTVTRNSEVMLGQTQNYFLENYVILCNVITFYTIYLVIITFDITVLNWHYNGIILKSQFHFIFIRVCLNIRDTNTAAKKILKIINLLRKYTLNSILERHLLSTTSHSQLSLHAY